MDLVLIGWIAGGIIAGWIAAGAAWHESDPDDVGRYLLPILVMFLWPVVVVAGLVGGLVWLFVQSAKPGLVKLPRPRRERLRQRIADLEAELGMRDQP